MLGSLIEIGCSGRQVGRRGAPALEERADLLADLPLIDCLRLLRAPHARHRALRAPRRQRAGGLDGHRRDGAR